MLFASAFGAGRLVVVAILPILEFELGQNLLPKKVFLLHTELDIWSMSHWSIYL